MTNKNEFVAAMKRVGLNQEQVAEYLGISTTALNNKINNKSEFKASEIQKLIVLFKIDPDDSDSINKIFFAPDVDLESTSEVEADA